MLTSVYNRIVMIIVLSAFLLSGVIGVVALINSDNCIIKTNELCIGPVDVIKKFKIKNYEKLSREEQSAIIQAMLSEIAIQKTMKKLNFNISNEVISKYLVQNETFLTNGEFDQEKFNSFLRKNDFTVRDFKESMKLKLFQISILPSLFNTSIKQNNRIIDMQWKLFSSVRHVDYFTYDLNVVALNKKPTDDELRDIYSEKIELFNIPETKDVSYIVLKEKDIPITVSDSEYTKFIESVKKNNQDFVINDHIKTKIIEGIKHDKRCEMIYDAIDQVGNGKNIQLLSKKLKIEVINSKISSNSKNKFEIAIFNEIKDNPQPERSLLYFYIDSQKNCDAIIFYTNATISSKVISFEESKKQLEGIWRENETTKTALMISADAMQKIDLAKGNNTPNDTIFKHYKLLIDNVNEKKMSNLGLYVTEKTKDLAKGDKFGPFLFENQVIFGVVRDVANNNTKPTSSFIEGINKNENQIFLHSVVRWFSKNLGNIKVNARAFNGVTRD